jgi:hypothetical protein
MSGMSSALEKWTEERCPGLGSLEDVHGKVTGKQRGRQRATVHLNRALFVALSAAFQASRSVCSGRRPRARLAGGEALNM